MKAHSAFLSFEWENVIQFLNCRYYRIHPVTAMVYKLAATSCLQPLSLHSDWMCPTPTVWKQVPTEVSRQRYKISDVSNPAALQGYDGPTISHTHLFPDCFCSQAESNLFWTHFWFQKSKLCTPLLLSAWDFVNEPLLLVLLIFNEILHCSLIINTVPPQTTPIYETPLHSLSEPVHSEFNRGEVLFFPLN